MLLPSHRRTLEASLIILTLVTALVPLTDLPLTAPVGLPPNTPNIAYYLFYRTRDVMSLSSYLWSQPDLLDWMVSHSQQLSTIYSSDEAIDLVLNNPWLLQFQQALYNSDPQYYDSLASDPQKTRQLFNWLVDHPAYRNLLLDNPAVLRSFVESGYDESFLRPSVRIVSPFPYSTVEGDMLLRITSNPLYPFSRVVATWSNSQERDEIGNWQGPPANITATYDTSSLAPGAYVIRAEATIENGTVLADSVGIFVRPKTRLRAEIISPEDNSFIQGNFAVEATINSTHLIRSAVLYVDSELRGVLSRRGADIYQITLDSGMLGDGEHSLQVLATNVLGTSNASAPHTIKVDNFPAEIVINAPANNTQTTESALTVKATINDYAAWAKIYVNGVPQGCQTYNSTYVATAEFSLDLSQVIVDRLSITVRYESALGHVGSATHVICR